MAHYKYTRRELVNGKWKYYYDQPGSKERSTPFTNQPVAAKRAKISDLINNRRFTNKPVEAKKGKLGDLKNTKRFTKTKVASKTVKLKDTKIYADRGKAYIDDLLKRRK